MKMRLSIWATCLFLLAAGALQAQTGVSRLDSAINGTTLTMSGGRLVLHDDDTQGEGAPTAGGYKKGIDYSVTIKGTCSEPLRLVMEVNELSVGCLDTVYIYDGPTATGTPMIAFNSFTGNVNEKDLIYVSPANTSGALTVRFVTDPRTDSSHVNMPCNINNQGVTKGFSFIFFCQIPCEKLVPVIESKFYRTRNGEVYDSSYIQMIHISDTVYNEEGNPASGVHHIDTQSFIGANLCIGDGLILHGHGEYSNKYGYYNPTDATTYFNWNMANDGDSIDGIGITEVIYNDYQTTGCFDINLKLVDAFGCHSTVIPTVRIRTAMNPIRTMYPLNYICTRDSLPVNIGYEGDNATIILSKIESDSSVSKEFIERTFIPDGPYCTDPYYEAPVVFSEFPAGRKVTTASDICSICINMEHSWMDDVYITIVCPSGQEAVLKYGRLNNGSTPTGIPPKSNPPLPGQDGGGNRKLGFPLQSNKWNSTSNRCDSLYNNFGEGLNYCFSRDTAYVLVTGQRAGDVWSASNLHPAGDFYLGSPTNLFTVNLDVTYPVIPSGFNNAGTVPDAATVSTKMPSNYEEKINYYLPFSDFDTLVGCDLNGEWKIRVYDVLPNDNGWIFGWTMDICDYSNAGCNYQVAIDSLVWVPDDAPQYHDYDLGYYRGAVVHKESPLKSWILTPDTAGSFPILVHVYDEFGCVWTDTAQITSFWSPAPDLGPDTALCGIHQILLDASDRHANSAGDNFSYVWEPYGQNTPTIQSADNPESQVTYIVEVTNTHFTDLPNPTQCRTFDTITVFTRKQPLPSVYPSPFVLEGCEPFTVKFENQSADADIHHWVFGDGTISDERSPEHTYMEGVYDLRYYATSNDGCVDSIISPEAIWVYSSPKASFSWSPTYPSVTHPIVTLNNTTTPKTPATRYFWEVQYNLDNPISVETMTDENPVFDITQYMEGNPAGNYSIKLISRSENLPPSGNTIVCADSMDNNILVVNDFLQFPNVVSPNGDGINDRFEIINLIEGLGFPINSLDIYNKWGTRVYHKENISDPADYWDPSDVPTGTYFFRFSARGYNGNIEHNGAIEVIR